MRPLILLFIGAAAAFATEAVASNGGQPRRSVEPFEVHLTLDVGEDLGQDLGSLFEARNPAGQLILGAGFNAGSNYRTRSNNRVLTFFYRGLGRQLMTPLPRPSSKVTWPILQAVDNRLLEFKSSQEFKAGRWTKGLAGLKDADYVQLLSNRHLAFYPHRIEFAGRIIYSQGVEEPDVFAGYYFDGKIFISRAVENRIFTCNWTPRSPAPIDLKSCQVYDMHRNGEAVYTFGNYRGWVLCGTRYGNVHVFKDGKWSGVSVDVPGNKQFYSMQPFRKSLLLGEYPTGRIYEFDGATVKLFPKQPPLLPGTDSQGREAQTMTIYQGDLYVGFWPWGELWRMDSDTLMWEFVSRMFSGPAMELNFRPGRLVYSAPYIEEALAADLPVLYEWGQRVVGLENFSDSLFVATGNLDGNGPDKAAIDAIGKTNLAEYGNLFKITRDLSVSGQVSWPSGPTSFVFKVDSDGMTIIQDGKLVGRTPWPILASGATLGHVTVLPGNGVFGPMNGILANFKVIQQSVGNSPARN